MTNNTNNHQLPEGPRRYEYSWRNKWLTAKATSIDDMIGSLQTAADELRKMKARGVTLDEGSSVGDDYATLITDDPSVAEEFGFDEPDADDEDEGEEGGEGAPAKPYEIEYVPSGKHTAGWLHTHGMEKLGLPNFEVRGVPGDLAPTAAGVLGEVCDTVRRQNRAVRHGDEIQLPSGVRVRFVRGEPIPENEEHYLSDRLQVEALAVAGEPRRGSRPTRRRAV
jgi:hypothetical protein